MFDLPPCPVSAMNVPISMGARDRAPQAQDTEAVLDDHYLQLPCFLGLPHQE